MGNSENVSNFRRNRKQNLISLMGEKCAICGYNKTNAALEFHHINKEDKSYGIASNGTCHSIEKDIAEVEKCLLVCANCHREIHAGLYEGIDLFNFQIIDEKKKRELLNKNKPKIYFCKNCGVSITRYSTSGLCSDCVRRKNSNYPTREELKEMIRVLPFTKIGNDYGVTDNAVRKWCKKMNLPYKKNEINNYTDNQWKEI